MKDALSYFIGEWIEELQDGFQNGLTDVVVFFRDNFKALLIAGAGPEMGMMVSMMGTDTIMRYVTSANNRYKERKAIIIARSKERELRKKQNLSSAPIAAPKFVPEDTKMEEVEEQKEVSAEELKRRFWAKWKETVDEDYEDIQEEAVEQRPLSRAYLSLCPVNRNSNKQVQDEKTASQDYLAQGQKVNFKEEYVRQTIRVHLMKAGFPQ